MYQLKALFSYILYYSNNGGAAWLVSMSVPSMRFSISEVDPYSLGPWHIGVLPSYFNAGASRVIVDSTIYNIK